MSKRAVILMNLGGPDDLTSVQPFLFNLFNDPAIIGLPGAIRWFLAQLISRRRAPTAREIYKKMGGCSPLLRETEAQAEGIGARLGTDDRVFISMRYWSPRSYETVEAVRDYNPSSIVLLPLYPQYSSTTTGSSVTDWSRAAKKAGLCKPTTLIGCYATNAGFILAHAELLREVLETNQSEENVKVLFSAHGLPEKIVAKGDPYQWQVEKTVEAIVQELDYPDLDWKVCYQSRVGPLSWIGPSTEEEIAAAGRRKQSVVIVPVAFVSEHSETLVELDIEYAELARKEGVRSYKRVAALGVSGLFLDALCDMVNATSASLGQASPIAGRTCPPEFTLCCKTPSAISD